MKSFINITLSLFLLHLYIYINDVASEGIANKNNHNLRNAILKNNLEIENVENIMESKLNEENDENVNNIIVGNDVEFEGGVSQVDLNKMVADHAAKKAKKYAEESAMYNRLFGWEFGGGAPESEASKRAREAAEKEAAEKKAAEKKAAAEEEAAMYNRLFGWEFGGGAPENKTEENMLKPLPVSPKDKEHISKENEDTVDESEEQIEEIGEIEEIQENNEEETELEINENEEESSEEEEKEEEKDQKKEEKSDEQSKENKDQSTDMKAQNIISENYKNYNNVKEAAETIMKTLVGLFSGNNEMDSTLKGLAEEISQYFKNH
ncbi:merozoite surface protein 3 [Plasmodium sp. gorilla clade G2]|uniref:merozoite surface protein 3 n=1 Tax=Plasmodium sp. gorilla clade G2 TaxID=880535 RepID=UPI000D2127FF|nr:merozoite surface protein 3 [Plasmodium sp. gorilla clade G2]SOV15229.1 merozoite surface protein 3 [Plasmodium sp. gorilla clade G2]